jgi:hypothetical protein
VSHLRTRDKSHRLRRLGDENAEWNTCKNYEDRRSQKSKAFFPTPSVGNYSDRLYIGPTLTHAAIAIMRMAPNCGPAATAPAQRACKNGSKHAESRLSRDCPLRVVIDKSIVIPLITRICVNKCLLLVGTKKASSYSRARDRSRWKLTGPFHTGREINHAIYDLRTSAHRFPNTRECRQERGRIKRVEEGIWVARAGSRET